MLTVLDGHSLYAAALAHHADLRAKADAARCAAALPRRQAGAASRLLRASAQRLRLASPAPLQPCC